MAAISMAQWLDESMNRWTLPAEHSGGVQVSDTTQLHHAPVLVSKKFNTHNRYASTNPVSTTHAAANTDD